MYWSGDFSLAGNCGVYSNWSVEHKVITLTKDALVRVIMSVFIVKLVVLYCLWLSWFVR